VAETGFDWSARLAPGETLLWQGRPVPPERPQLWPPMDRSARRMLAALLAGLALVLLLQIGPRAGVLGWLALAGLIAPLGFGLWFISGGQVRWTRFWLLRTRYALTDRRALIARRVLGRDWIAAVPVARFTPPGRAPQGATGHVVFRSFTAAQVGRAGRQSHAMAFWYIPDAARVQALIEGLIPRG
jgi:hypothetical protein